MSPCETQINIPALMDGSWVVHATNTVAKAVFFNKLQRTHFHSLQLSLNSFAFKLFCSELQRALYGRSL